MRATRCGLFSLVVVLTIATLAAFGDPPAKTTNSSGGAKTLRDVEYAKVGQKSLWLDLYTPAGADKPLPLIVWIHGGGWMSGDKKDCPLLAMVGKGYVVASLNYRFTQEAIFPAQIEDCKAAIRFLRGNAKKYSIDPARVGVSGVSAGGHLVALLGTSGGVKELEGKVGQFPEQSSRVQAVVDFCGPADLPLFLKKMTPGSTKPLQQLLGGGDAVEDLAVKASPVTYAAKTAPPFLIIQGDKDDIVPLNQSESMRDALKAAGADVTLFVVRGAGHGGINPATLKMTGDFFDKHLKSEAKASSVKAEAGAAATTKPAPVCTFYGNGGNAQHVAFCIDASGSMAFASKAGGSSFSDVRTNMLASIGGLMAEQDFRIVIFQENQPIMSPGKGLVSATKENREAAAQWANKVVPHGAGADPIPALNRCFDMLNAAKGNDKVIFLLTDGAFPNDNAVLKCIQARNKAKNVHVFTYLYGEQDDESAVKLMKAIADETGGKYKNIRE